MQSVMCGHLLCQDCVDVRYEFGVEDCFTSGCKQKLSKRDFRRAVKAISPPKVFAAGQVAKSSLTPALSAGSFRVLPTKPLLPPPSTKVPPQKRGPFFEDDTDDENAKSEEQVSKRFKFADDFATLPDRGQESFP